MPRGFTNHHLTSKYELTGYAWGRLPEGSLVVDVGGGVGSQSLTLATHFPHLRFVVQDREAVVADAVEVRGLKPPASSRSDSRIWPDNSLATVLEGEHARRT
jgi:hypothetical protein